MIRLVLFLFVCFASCGARAGVITDAKFSNIEANWSPVGIHSGLLTYPFAIPQGTVEILSDVTTTISTISQSINVVAGDIVTFNWSAGLFPDVPDPSNKYASSAFWIVGTQKFNLKDLDVSQVDPLLGIAAASGSVTFKFDKTENGLLLKFGIEEIVPSINDTAFTTLAIDTLEITSNNNNAIPEPSSAICICLLTCTVFGMTRHRRLALV